MRSAQGPRCAPEFVSSRLVGAQRDDRVAARRALRRNHAREHAHSGEHERRDTQHRRIARRRDVGFDGTRPPNEIEMTTQPQPRRQPRVNGADSAAPMQSPVAGCR